MILVTIAVVVMTAVSTRVCAQENAIEDTLINEEEVLAADTMVNNDPEWYVAPVDRAIIRAPKRAAEGTCPIDSVQTYDVNGNLTHVSIYEYGDTTRTITWAINNGSRVGESKMEYANDGFVYYGATYTWDNTISNWKGVDRADTIYNEARKMTSRTEYVWVNNAWVPDVKYTYAYDAANRETEFTTYKRNASTNQLMLSKQRIREWYNASKTTLDIQYTAHNGTDWSKGTKKAWVYDDNGYTKEYYEYKSLLAKDVWGGAGSIHEVTAWLTATKKINYLKQVWSEGDFVNNTHEIWHYNGPSQAQTFYEKQTWSNGAWVGSDQDTIKYEKFGTKTLQTVHQHNIWSNGVWVMSVEDSLWYNASGGKILDAKYTFSNGVRTGKNYRTEWILTGLKSTITYSWKNGAWARYRKTIKDNVLGADTIENCTYSWSSSNGGQWVAYSKRTLSINGGSETITQSWGNNDWVNSTRTTTIGSTANPTQTASFVWNNGEWYGYARTDYHYYAPGQPDTIKTYRPIGTEWVDSLRTVNTYNANGIKIMVHNAKWNGSRWVMQSMSRTDMIDCVVDGIRQTLNATWHCQNDSVWVGEAKDTTAYLPNGKPIYRAVYDDWQNNDWVPYYYVNYEYDEAYRPTLEERFEWNGVAWYGKNRDESEYDEQGNKTLEASYKSWDNVTNTWIGSAKTEKVFDSNQAVISSILSVWGENSWRQVFRTTYTRDEIGREVDQIVEHFEENQWLNSDRYIHTYNGATLIKDNAYKWLDNQWKFTSRNETYYDEDAQAKLRRKVSGLWNEGDVVSFADDHYYYDCDLPHMYTIQFVNEDGTLLEAKQVLQGQVPSYDETPTKVADTQHEYTFTNWSPEVVAATGDATYTAIYTATLRKYMIRFEDENGTELQSGLVEYGLTPAYTGSTPSKTATEEYTYAFAGWDNEPVAVMGEATYTATYTPTKRSYTIRFKDEDGTELQSGLVEYGQTPSYGETPTKVADTQHEYTFTNWSPEVVAVTGDATYTAIYTATLRKYTIRFEDENGTELQSGLVEYGQTPAYTGATPSKTATEEYTYAFAGWDNELVAVTGEATYIATYTPTKRSYMIRFEDENGTELQSGLVEYGLTPAYTGSTPSKTATEEYTYAFAGWDNEPVAVVGEATYTATYTPTKRSYMITWLMDDGSVVDQAEMEYGTTPAHANINKENTAKYTYTFTGWSPQVSSVIGEASYIAQFDSVINKYTVTFYFEDGVTVIKSMEVAYGEMPSIDITPSRVAEEHYYYVFAGWSPEITEVTGDVNYTANFNKKPKEYEILFKDWNGAQLLKANVAYGTVPEYTGTTPERRGNAHYSYTFTGWSPELTEVTGNATYTAVYKTVVNMYTVQFLDEDGTELENQLVAYGVVPAYQGEMPTKEDDEEYRYIFAGWSPRVTAVTSDAAYYATYTAHKKTEGFETIADHQSPISTKVMIDGRIYIIRGGHTYTTDGRMVE
jgi:hypothetical protein